MNVEIIDVKKQSKIRLGVTKVVDRFKDGPRPFCSRTEEIQMKFRSGRSWYDRPRGRNVLDVVGGSTSEDPIKHIERQARFWMEVHRAWLGPLVAKSWEEAE